MAYTSQCCFAAQDFPKNEPELRNRLGFFFTTPRHTQSPARIYALLDSVVALF
jgi:hypothetical protein